MNKVQPLPTIYESTKQLTDFIKGLTDNNTSSVDSATLSYVQAALIGVLSLHREEVSTLIDSYHKKETDNA